jgi:hypothetical protein
MLLKNLPQAAPGGLTRQPSTDPPAYLAVLDGVNVSQELRQSVEESSKAIHGWTPPFSNGRNRTAFSIGTSTL